MKQNIDAERSILCDYLVRMIGDIYRAKSECFEVTRIFLEEAYDEQLIHYPLRVRLFSIARRFNKDIWFGDYGSIYKDYYIGLNNAEFLLNLEKYLQSLTHETREILLMRYRYDLTAEEIAFVINKSLASVEELINACSYELNQRLGNEYSLKYLSQLVTFDLNESHHSTLAIDEVVGQIVKPWQTYLRRFLLLLWLVPVLSAVYWFFLKDFDWK